jgi:vanillate O-demethylase monooxygenase subunit
VEQVNVGDALDQWCPALLSRDLRSKPVPVRLFDVDYVIFRTRGGRVGALTDSCPHRHMRLSRGRVEGENLVCPYHGWRLSPCGKAFIPWQSAATLGTECLDVAEHDGVVWVKRTGTTTHSLPSLFPSGFWPVHTACRLVGAPAEIVFDNFTEVEHTAFAHWKFGYDPAAMPNLEHRVSDEGDHTLIDVAGPQKALPRPFSGVFGVRSGDIFRIRYRAYCRPFRAEFDWWWEEPTTRQDRGLHFREIAYFMPASDNRSRLFSHILWNRSPRGGLGWNWVLTTVMSRVIAYEIEIDIWLVENIIPDARDLSACVLGRFDAQLRHHRRLVERIEN